MPKPNIVDKKYNFLRPIKTKGLIRLGGKEDGGYIVDENIINECDTLITFGLGPQWTFELDYIKRNKNLSIHIYDHTVSSFPYLKEIWKYLKRFLTLRVSYEAVKNRINYYKAYKNFLNLSNVKFFGEKITVPIKKKIDTDIKKAFSRINSNSKVILKSDIEGSEYEIIDQILEYSEKIKMLIFEFHWIDKKEKEFIDSMKKLQSRYEIIHIHGNNHLVSGNSPVKNNLPIVLEITLLNKNLIKNKDGYISDFPVAGLDFPNNPYLEDISFSFRD